jgi:hypothetical protein
MFISNEDPFPVVQIVRVKTEQSEQVVILA